MENKKYLYITSRGKVVNVVKVVNAAAAAGVAKNVNKNHMIDALEMSMSEHDEESAVAAALTEIAIAVKYLGNSDAGTSLGATEDHGKFVSESIHQGLSEIAEAINRHASAEEEVAAALTSRAGPGASAPRGGGRADQFVNFVNPREKGGRPTRAGEAPRGR